jgi:hypothetical protein
MANAAAAFPTTPQPCNHISQTSMRPEEFCAPTWRTALTQASPHKFLCRAQHRLRLTWFAKPGRIDKGVVNLLTVDPVPALNR